MTEEYLTVTELSERIKYSEQSLYNLINKGTLKLRMHYLKPTPKKILFKWSAILTWMGEDDSEQRAKIAQDTDSTKKSSECSINI